MMVWVKCADKHLQGERARKNDGRQVSKSIYREGDNISYNILVQMGDGLEFSTDVLQTIAGAYENDVDVIIVVGIIYC